MSLNAHMKITWITLVTLSVHCCVVMAQTTFQKNYGTFNADGCADFVITADSGYAAVGYNVNIGAGSQDVCLIKTDKSGVLEWARNYGGVNQETASSVALTQDGGYILCGYTNSYGAGFDDIYVIRTDSVGGVVWAKVFGSPGSERGHEVIATNDGGFVVVGGTYGFGAGSMDAYLLKLDLNGNVEILKAYGGAGYDEAFSVIQTNDGGFGLTGSMSSFGAGGEDIYFIRTDSKGDVIWSRTYGGDLWDRASSIEQTSDGGYIIAGFTESFAMMKHYVLQCYLLKVDSIGVPQWSKAFGKMNSENIAHDVIQSADGGYCVAGYSGHFTGDYRAYVVKTDASGDLEWSKIQGEGTLNTFEAVAQTYDGGFVMGGYTNGLGALTEMWLSRGDSFGFNKCYSADSVTLMKDTIPIVTVPGDTAMDGIFADTSAVFDTSVVLDETVICSNLCNVVASFEIADTILCIGDTLFLSSSSVGADNVLWYFAGEVYADTTDTFYVADSLGTYNFALVADSQFCEDEHSYDITITDTVISDFTFVINNLTVDFEEETEYANSLTWYFGTGDTDTVDNPLYTYPDTGMYTACLVAQSTCSSDSTCYAIYINCSYPLANYSYVATGLSVDFTNLTTLADSYYWIFGDGNASSDTNATHSYAASGTYEVCLIATNSCGSSDTCLDVTVMGDTTGMDEFNHLNPHVYMDAELKQIILRIDQRVDNGIKLALTNMLGQKIDIVSHPSLDGREYVIGTPSISPGLYYLTLTLGSYTYIEKLLIMK